MAAYKTQIPRHLCVVCKSKAAVEVFNTYNASCGYYCTRHGVQRVKELNKLSPIAPAGDTE